MKRILDGIALVGALALLAWASGCSDDKHYTGWCSEQSECPDCLACVYSTCISGVDPCGDRLDNDCDGETDEGCPDPCERIICDHPPERSCIDSDRLRAYAVPGNCTFGECAYMPLDVACPAGCERGACVGDACLGLTCLEDGNPCTDDGCDPRTGCTHTPNAAPCEDGDLCTGQDVCRGGVCLVGGGRDCDDGIACTSERCDSAIGCVIIPDDLACDDLDPCTDDRCNASAGCLFSFNTAPCDDGDPCTMEDTCAQGICMGVPKDLDHDGFIADGCGGDDCNDNEAWLNPNAEEVCDGYDNDCDGMTDMLGEDLCHYEAICHRGVMTHCPAGSGQTIVASILDRDNIWCSTGSPFLLEQDTTILVGAIVTAGPCLEILASSGIILRIRGGLSVRAELSNPAVFRSAMENPQQGSWVGIWLEDSGNISLDLQGAVIMHADVGLHFSEGMAHGPVTLQHSRFETNREGLGGFMVGGIEAQHLDFVDNGCGVEGARKSLLHCTFSGNEKGLCRSAAYLVDCVLSNNMIGIEGWAASLENCEITDNDIGIVPFEPYGGPELHQCNLQRNRIGILVARDGMYPLHSSTFCDNTESDIRMTGTRDMDATDNWWCTTDPQDISSRIYDVYDDNALGRVIFEPFLTEEP